MDVSTWLRDLGLENYIEAFQAHDIDAEVLPRLTADDLVALGMTSVGHRRKLLDAIAALDQGRNPAPAAVVRPLDAERRQLTVLFCDLVGSTELAARLDPEDLREVMRAYQTVSADVVGRFEGHIARFLGDGVLAYFGWPRAHEDDAERAVRTGLQLVQDVARLESRAGVRLQARVGVATGHVVVGDLISECFSDKDAVSGDTPNLAARLQAAAAPASVVISPVTRRLVGGLFELTELGPRRLKGFAEPVSAWQVEGQRRAEGRFEARQTTGLMPLVGREEEIALLLRRWRQAANGEGQVVLLSGEPGIGKSRLVRELHGRLGGEPHLRLTYQCSPHHQTRPLHPVIEQLERAAGFERGHSPETRLDKLEALLARGRCARPVISGRFACDCPDKLEQVVSLVAALLSVPTGDRYPLPDLTPQRQKQLTLEALVDQLEGLAAGQPVLLICEDAHWADPTTQELLALTTERIQRLPILLLITFRPEFVPPWSGQPHLSAIRLTRLGQREGAAMVGQVGRGKALPGEVSAQIVAKADGVPLFIEELTKTVLESGLLEEMGDRYELAGALPPLSIPATLHDSLMARLDRLAAAKETAQIGAAIGREFSYDLLAAVAPLDEPHLGHALEQLTRSELVFRRGSPSDAIYEFKHALVRDAAYASLLKSKRRSLHTRIAKVLGEQFPTITEGQPDVLAHHCTEAGLVEQAIEYWLKAGKLAVIRSANAEAVAQLTRGLELLDQLPPDLDRSRRELDFQLPLANALGAVIGHGMPEARRACARAVELAEQVGDVPRLLPALDGLITCHFHRGEVNLAMKFAKQLLEQAERTRGPAPRLIAHTNTGTLHLAVGNLSSAREDFEQALALSAPGRHDSQRLAWCWDPGVVCRSYMSWTLLALGYPKQALKQSLASVAEARRLSHPLSLASALAISGVFAHLRRSPQALQKSAEALMRLAHEQGFRYHAITGRLYDGLIQVQRGHVDEGLALLRENLGALRRGGDEDWFSHSLLLIAEAHHQAQRADEAWDLLGEALERVEHKNERCFEAEIHRLRGEVLLSLSRSDQAEECFHQALAAARGQKAKLWELRAVTSLARLWRDRAKRREARDLLAPVYGWFTEGFDTADLKDAKALLDELG